MLVEGLIYNIIMWEMGNNNVIKICTIEFYIGEEGSDIFRSLTIAGGLLGVLTVILLILVTVVGTVILVQKGIIFDRSSINCAMIICCSVCIGSLIWRRVTKRKLT